MAVFDCAGHGVGALLTMILEAITKDKLIHLTECLFKEALSNTEGYEVQNFRKSSFRYVECL